MQGLAVFVGLVAIGYGYGFAVGGVAGALTGLVAGVGTGSGLAIGFAEGGTGVAAAGPVRGAQRMGGFLTACGCVVAAYFGGWAWGWAWGVAGYAAGVAAAFALGELSRRGAEDSDQVSSPRGYVPTAFDLNDRTHVEAIDDIRQTYAETLQNETGPYARCRYRPSSLLPYPKPVIKAALTALLDFVESRRASVLLDGSLKTAQVADDLEAALADLDDFLDVAPEKLPTDPLENASIGLQLRQEV